MRIKKINQIHCRKINFALLKISGKITYRKKFTMSPEEMRDKKGQ
jgi:hypothetical protein